MTVKSQLTGKINQEENAFRRALNIQMAAETTAGQIGFILGRKILTVVVVMMMMKTTNTKMNTNFELKL
jgi:hypothetical protein